MSVFSLVPKHQSSTFAKGVTLAAIFATLTGCALKPVFQSEEEKTSAAVLASPLFDAPRFAHHFETALRGMWKHWCQQQEKFQ